MIWIDGRPAKPRLVTFRAHLHAAAPAPPSCLERSWALPHFSLSGPPSCASRRSSAEMLSVRWRVDPRPGARFGGRGGLLLISSPGSIIYSRSSQAANCLPARRSWWGWRRERPSLHRVNINRVVAARARAHLRSRPLSLQTEPPTSLGSVLGRPPAGERSCHLGCAPKVGAPDEGAGSAL